ncbi:odorant receptor 4-like [Vespula maculifrons]|uniref:Odorant receptor 4-like n=1 Tax=Vespula maculifrons TaxID=7453 RepID=A0ABD2BPQ2_VESMC
MKSIRNLDFRVTSKMMDLNERECSDHEPICIFFALYLFINIITSFISITDNVSNIEYIIGCYLMHVQFCDTNKVKDVQKKRKSLAELLKDIKIDLIAERYKTDVEKIAFLKYNNINLKLVLIRFKISEIKTLEILITRTLIASTSMITYVCLYLYQFIIILNTIFGYIGMNYLSINLVLHIGSIISALFCEVKHILNITENRGHRIRNLILRHIPNNSNKLELQGISKFTKNTLLK